MTKKKRPERRLTVISKRRQPTEEGVMRIVAAMVLYQLEQTEAPESEAEDTA